MEEEVVVIHTTDCPSSQQVLGKDVVKYTCGLALVITLCAMLLIFINWI